MITRSGDLLTTEVDGELLAMSIENGACYGLNRIGSRIWQLVEQPCTVDNLCARLVEEFEVDAEICRTEVLALLADLRTEKLIQLNSGPGPEPGQ
ncbi:MAG: PqqD family peptide modification chaperone [Brevundimonas sp.]